ncbi:MAG: segregation and condensation protein A [Sphingobacteriaceae bacterium]
MTVELVSFEVLYMSGENFEVRLPQFEGPFDLLLFFIERDELEIQDIPIAKITDDFLNYLHHLSRLNMELASEFIFVAATLMRIKAKMLLPRPDLDDSGNEFDPKQDLIQKLMEYKKYKLLCETLRVFEDQRFLQEKRGNIQQDTENAAHLTQPAEELSSFDLYKLVTVYQRVLQRYQQKPSVVTHVVTHHPYTMEQQKKSILALLQINQRLDFKALAAKSENKVQFVYNFLAMLEMLQQELIDIQIGLGFNNFHISNRQQRVVPV